MKKIMFIAIILLSISNVFAESKIDKNKCDFPSFIKKSLKGKESAYCIDGKKLPLFTVGGHIISGHNAKIYVNNELKFNIIAKRWSGFSGTINHHLNFNKTNSVKIEYELVETQDNSFIRKIFEVKIEAQNNWKDPKSSKVITSLVSPNNNVLTKGETGVVEIIFIPTL